MRVEAFVSDAVVRAAAERYLDVDARRMFGYVQRDLKDFELFAQYVGEYISTLDQV